MNQNLIAQNIVHDVLEWKRSLDEWSKDESNIAKFTSCKIGERPEDCPPLFVEFSSKLGERYNLKNK